MECANLSMHIPLAPHQLACSEECLTQVQCWRASAASSPCHQTQPLHTPFAAAAAQTRGGWRARATRPVQSSAVPQPRPCPVAAAEKGGGQSDVPVQAIPHPLRVIVSVPSPRALWTAAAYTRRLHCIANSAQRPHLERRQVGIALSAVDEHRQAARALRQLQRQTGWQRRVSTGQHLCAVYRGFSAAGPPSRAPARQQLPLPVCSFVAPCKPPAALKHN